MRKILKSKQIEKMIYNRDKVLIGGLPFSGKTTLIREACQDYCNENGIQVIELPKKFNSIDELNEWKQKIKEVPKAIIEGRNYIIELILGKVSIADKPSLQSPYLDFRGNVVSMRSIDAIKRIYENDIRDDKAISKILMYSTIAMPNYYTIIPKLVNEGIELYKQGKLDKVLEIVLGLKRLYSSFPKADISGEDSIVYALGLVLPRDIDFKTAWNELSETWKELIYYRLDSVLRLLPGSAEKIISQRDVKSLGDKVSVVDIDPFFVDLAEWGKSIILNDNNLCIIGPIRSAKSTLANYIYSVINSKDIDIIDYNNYDLLNLSKKIMSENKRYIAVLTDDIFYSIFPECNVIDSNNYVKDFIDYLYLKNNAKRKRDVNTDVPLHYYHLYRLKYKMNKEQIKSEYKSDMSKYIINTIFGNNKELINNYLPLLILGKNYLPLPTKVSEIVLNYFNRQTHETFIDWFSAFDFNDYDMGEDQEIRAKENEVFQKVRKDLIREVKENRLEEDLLEVFFDNLLIFKFLPDTKIDDFVKTAYGDYSPIVNTLLYNPDIIDEFNWDLGERSREVCNSLKSLEDMVKEEAINSVGITPKLVEITYEFLSSKVNNYIKIYRLLSSQNVDTKCLSKAFEMLKWYIIYGDDSDVFNKFENMLYNVVSKVKDDNLIRDYLKMSFANIMQSKIYTNEEHINQIAEASNYSKFASLPIFILNKIINDEINVEDIKDPIELYTALLIFFVIEKNATEENVLEDVIHYHDYLEDLYNKFIRYAKKLDENIMTIIFDIVLDFPAESRDQILDILSAGMEIINFTYAMLIFYNYNGMDNQKDALEYINTLIETNYNSLIKKEELNEDDVFTLFEIYKVKLAKTLITSKYDYKSVLQDIVDLRSKANVISKKLKAGISIAYLISKLLLNREVEKTIPNVPEATLYMAALALMGNEEMKKEFYKMVEGIRINGKLVTGDLDNILQKLPSNNYLIPTLEVYFYLKGDHENLSKVINHVEEKMRGIPLFILNKMFSEINVKGNRNRYIASLILFV
ncbi:hypothetical protein J5U21_01945 [Saccharolobus shibatae]|uniref:Uncharacterized protein n=2 Tax=Saccharolobus shibatae TaxID=2286 RepID=A0A8F5GWP5_9CREN|nr:hypothetical protein J5U21_01945 [Saccharolobus shibatae]